MSIGTAVEGGWAGPLVLSSDRPVLLFVTKPWRLEGEPVDAGESVLFIPMWLPGGLPPPDTVKAELPQESRPGAGPDPRAP